MRVEFSPQADSDADEGLDWWFEHRDKAPQLFRQELHGAVKKLGKTPLIGERVATPGASFEVRYVSMPKTRFRVYYRVKADAGVVEVLRLWHMSRGEAPTFRGVR